jgi:hypothetical protein
VCAPDLGSCGTVFLEGSLVYQLRRRNATCVFSCFQSSFNGLTKLVCPFIVAVNLILRIAATPAACSIEECVLWAFVVYR